MTSFVIRDTVNDLVSNIPDSGQVNGISGVTEASDHWSHDYLYSK